MTADRDATARRFAWPVPNLWRGNSLSDEDLHAYCQFRLTFMNLKPRVDPAEDYARFAAWVKSADFVWLERAEDGQLLGATSVKLERRTHEGTQCVLIRTEYVFISPSIRKPAGAAMAVVVALCLAAWRHPGKPIYFVGAGYLSSFLAIAQVFEHSWFRADARMSPWEQTLWQALASEVRGYDPATQLIEMDTVPHAPRQRLPRAPAARARYDEYVEHNPRWTDGYGCVSFVRVERADLTRGLRMTARRMLPGGDSR